MGRTVAARAKQNCRLSAEKAEKKEGRLVAEETARITSLPAFTRSFDSVAAGCLTLEKIVLINIDIYVLYLPGVRILSHIPESNPSLPSSRNLIIAID